MKLLYDIPAFLICFFTIFYMHKYLFDLMHLKPSLCVKNISMKLGLRNGGSVDATNRFINELVSFTSLQHC